MQHNQILENNVCVPSGSDFDTIKICGEGVAVDKAKTFTTRQPFFEIRGKKDNRQKKQKQKTMDVAVRRCKDLLHLEVSLL